MYCLFEKWGFGKWIQAETLLCTNKTTSLASNHILLHLSSWLQSWVSQKCQKLPIFESFWISKIDNANIHGVSLHLRWKQWQKVILRYARFDSSSISRILKHEHDLRRVILDIQYYVLLGNTMQYEERWVFLEICMVILGYRGRVKKYCLELIKSAG